MATHQRANDPAHVDRLWVGYHPRALMPAVVLVALASLVVWTGRWYLDELSELADRAGVLAVFALAWCVWPALIMVFLYRTVTYTYRVTDRAVLVDFGFWHLPVPPVWLNEVAEVRAGAGFLGRVLGVGWVEVQTASRTVRLIGVRNPDEVAERIRVVATASRARDAKLGE